jgi:hypothetical protein
MSETETLLETVCRVLDYPAPPKEPTAGEFYRPARFSEPQPPVQPINRWMDVYIRELIVAREKHPADYAWPIEKVGTVAGRMREAFIGGCFIKDSHAIKATCKHFGIKHTYASIKAFLAGGQ